MIVMNYSLRNEEMLDSFLHKAKKMYSNKRGVFGCGAKCVLFVPHTCSLCIFWYPRPRDPLIDIVNGTRGVNIVQQVPLAFPRGGPLHALNYPIDVSAPLTLHRDFDRAS